MSTLAERLQRLVPEATIEDPGDRDERSLVVYGPPGTGKTTAMQRMVLDDLIQEDVDPQRIMVATFTRNARSQVLARLHQETALGDRSWPWVRTIHSACFRLLQLDQEQMISDADVREFGQACGYSFTGAERDGAPDGYPGLPSTKTYGDWALFAEDLRRACQLSIPEAVHALGRRRTPAAAHWSEVAARRFADEYRDFKRQNHLYDFTDLLEIVAAHRLRPPADRVYIDEAQDLTHLQWTVVDHWASGASAVVAIGDDDQAIYAFAGADPQALMRRPGARAVLSQSWRLPDNIHRTANQLVTRIHPRVEKSFRPIAEGGRLGRLYSWAGFPPEEGERWVVLARNRIHLSGVRRYLRQRLVPFADRTGVAGIPDPRSPTGRALQVAFDLHCGKLILGPRAISELRDSAPHRPLAKRRRRKARPCSDSTISSISVPALASSSCSARIRWPRSGWAVRIANICAAYIHVAASSPLARVRHL